MCHMIHSCSDIFQVDELPMFEFVLTNNHNISAKFYGLTGLLKSITVGSNEVRTDLDFVSYGARPGKVSSGAYLFMPDKEASSIVGSEGRPRVTIVKGPLVSI